MNARKKYPKEFKLDAISLVLDQGYTRQPPLLILPSPWKLPCLGAKITAESEYCLSPEICV